MPIAHVSLAVTDLQASKAFYLAALAPLGYELFKEFEGAIGFSPKMGGPDFWIHKCPAGTDGGIVKAHVALVGTSQAKVRAFHAAALKAGAKDNGPPGERPQYIKGYYAAYALDPDGHNIECLYFQPLWLTALQNMPAALAVAAVGAAWWAGKQGWMM